MANQQYGNQQRNDYDPCAGHEFEGRDTEDQNIQIEKNCEICNETEFNQTFQNEQNNLGIYGIT